MISNQSTSGWCLRMWAKWTVRRPRPRPRLGCPRRGRFMAALGTGGPADRGESAGVCRRGLVRRPAASPGGGSDLLSVLPHQLLEALAGLGPGRLLEGHFTAALALAGVLAGARAAAAQPRAVVLPGTVVGLGGGTGALAGTGVLAALALAQVQAAADVGLLEQRVLLLGVLGLGLVRLRPARAGAGQQPAQGR